MNQTALIDRIAEKVRVTRREATVMLDAFVETAVRELADGGEIHITGFCTLTTTVRGPREGRNPATGEPVLVGEKRVAKFKAGKALRERLNPPRLVTRRRRA